MQIIFFKQRNRSFLASINSDRLPFNRQANDTYNEIGGIFFDKVTVEKQGETVTHMECNVPELGNLNRGNVQKTYQNLVEFVTKINDKK